MTVLTEQEKRQKYYDERHKAIVTIFKKSNEHISTNKKRRYKEGEEEQEAAIAAISVFMVRQHACGVGVIDSTQHDVYWELIWSDPQIQIFLCTPIEKPTKIYYAIKYSRIREEITSNPSDALSYIITYSNSLIVKSLKESKWFRLRQKKGHFFF